VRAITFQEDNLLLYESLRFEEKTFYSTNHYRIYLTAAQMVSAFFECSDKLSVSSFVTN